MKKTMVNTRALIRKCQSKTRLTKLCFEIKNNRIFRLIKNLVLILYTSLLIFRDAEDQIKKTNNTNYTLRILCLVFVIFELFISLRALKSNYLRDSWNRFDFAMLVLTLIGYIMGETNRPLFMSLSRVLICALTVRLIRTTKGSKMMRILIDSFMISMPSILNVGCLLFLIIYIYSILGM